MIQNDAATPAVMKKEDDLLINWEEEEDCLLNTDSYHFDIRTLVLDQGLYVIRER
ncbi:MAG: hypothetical protein HY231_17800 [Acidobacteria bacterium]|nr:hypothetical protein [Acidobacteriota bacterium]